MSSESRQSVAQPNGLNPWADLAGDHRAHGLHNLGYTHLANGDPDLALVFFQHALQSAPDDVVILNNLGNAQFALRHYVEAEQAFRRAIDLDQTYQKPKRNLAQLYQITGRPDEAISAYRSYLQQSSADGQAHHNLGLLYVSQARIDEAAEAFATAAKFLTPDDAETATNVGVGWFYRGDFDKALSMFQRALQFDNAYVPARYHTGITLLYQGRFDQAIDELEAVVAAEPDHPQAAANLGVACNTAGQCERAIAIFQKLRIRKPADVIVLLNLALAYESAGQFERAAEHLREFLRSSPDTSAAQRAHETLERLEQQHEFNNAH